MADDDGVKPKPAMAAPGIRVTNMSRAAGAPAGAVKLEDYDPDEEIRQALAPDPKPSRLAWDLDDDRFEYDVELFEMNPINREVKINRYPNKAALAARLQEAGGRVDELNEGLRQIREANGGPAIIGSGGFDSGDIFSTGADYPGFQQFAGTPMGGWLNSEYIPMMTGPFTRQLYMYDYLKMHALVFEAVNHNPIARQAINITTSFVVGKGVTARAKTPRGQQVWNEFEHSNHIQEQLRTWSNELALYGEIMLRYMKNPYNGDLKIRPLDPATIWEIVTEPDDIELVYYYWQQYPTPWQMYTVQGVPTTRYIIRQLPADEVLHVKVNVVTGEKRGRSDLFCVLGWLKRFKDYTTAEVVRAQAAAAYVWDDTIQGSDADVQRHLAWLAQNPPSAGESFAHNEAIKRTFLSSTNRGPNLGPTGDMLMNVIAIGLGIPKEYLGINTGGARATALVATEPAARKFEMRQYVLEGVMHKVWNLVADAAGLEDDDRIIEFTFPSIATEDRSAKIQDVSRAEANLYLSKATAAAVVGKELAITTYSWDDERQKLMAELGVDPEHYIANAFAVVPKIPPAGPPPGMKGAPGAPGAAAGAPAPPRAPGPPDGGGRPPGQQPPVPPHPQGVTPGAGAETGRLARPRQPWQPPRTRLSQPQRVQASPHTQPGAADIRRDASYREGREPTREELIERAMQVEQELAAEKARRGGGTQYTLEQTGQPGGKKSASGVGGVIVIGQEDEYDREFKDYGRDADPRR